MTFSVKYPTFYNGFTEPQPPNYIYKVFTMSKSKISKLDKLTIKLQFYDSIISQLQSQANMIRISLEIERKRLLIK